MIAILIAVRDMLLALALGWVGVAFEAKPAHRTEASASAASINVQPSYRASACGDAA
ncbi:MAG: hypothetical protein AB7O04_00035 [Hyphomonadaceae bacterium]